MLSLIFLTTVASLVTAVHVPTRTFPPTFCHGQDCPRYTVVSSTADYEERLYEPAKWTSASVTGTYSAAVSAGFGKLFQYISGNNKDQAKIPMTVPVLTKIQPGQDFIVSFFVPYADQASPPEPSDPDVFTNPLPQMTAYVRHFSGYAGDADWVANANALAKSLDNATISYHRDFYYTAGYNSPFQPVDRHNEVWFIKSD
ncbi:heme-binding protein 2-like [Branchiostoma floridae]|uniref:Heme-binding protein 2-like n=1 Tax=Branchiostoma floridae TaxID=7739 RepID=A0A9J7N6N3_BRAFL|nr:heme-binding protein 2-like [Branchiostoma floridae]